MSAVGCLLHCRPSFNSCDRRLAERETPGTLLIAPNIRESSMHDFPCIGGLALWSENLISHYDDELAQLSRVVNSPVEGVVTDKSARKRGQGVVAAIDGQAAS